MVFEKYVRGVPPACVFLLFKKNVISLFLCVLTFIDDSKVRYYKYQPGTWWDGRTV